MKYPNIEAERARAGMNKTALAKALGVCYKTFYNWERNGLWPLPVLEKMAEMFNCSIDYLVENKEENE